MIFFVNNVVILPPIADTKNEETSLRGSHVSKDSRGLESEIDPEEEKDIVNEEVMSEINARKRRR